MNNRNIVKRLRDIVAIYGLRYPLLVIDCSDAATEINRLRALEHALRNRIESLSELSSVRCAAGVAGQDHTIETLRQLREFDRVKLEEQAKQPDEGHKMIVALGDYVEELEERVEAEIL